MSRRDALPENWEDCTIHVTELGWSTVGAAFEGIRVYTGDDPDQLYIFRLRDHLERLQRSMRLVRLTIEYNVDEQIDVTVDLLRAKMFAKISTFRRSPTPQTHWASASPKSAEMRRH